MPKSDTIHAICLLNPSAEPAFLSQFSSEELDAYLMRLTQLDRAPLNAGPQAKDASVLAPANVAEAALPELRSASADY